ncbi:MAG: FGGY-family carbohydrate kinase [Acidimicrobiia bacterium]
MILVVDVGTSSVRAVVVDGDAHVVAEHRTPLLPSSPAPGLVEFDAAAMADAALQLARMAIDEVGEVSAVGIANQRGSAIVWDRHTGAPVGPGIGWQDLRTVVRCLELAPSGVRLGPNHSATKFEALLDAADPDRARDLCIGTVDAWIVWTLTGGSVHATDGTNAPITGTRTAANDAWDTTVLEALRIPERTLPTVVDSSGALATASALPGAPPITGLLGDQQASLLGQGCVRPGDAKITFGTGGMLDLVLGPQRPPIDLRGHAGTYPIVTRRVGNADTWGLEAVMLSAGTNVEWLRDDLGLVASAEETDAVAATCADTGDVWFVPALLGLGTPQWDFGARGTLVGLTRGTERAHIVRAVLEGVAHRGADLVEAAEADSACTIEIVRIDGGMAANLTFVQALADATQRPVEVAPVREATAIGAAFAAGAAIGWWTHDDDIASTWKPGARVEPERVLDRDRWREAVTRAEAWQPDLSAIEF